MSNSRNGRSFGSVSLTSSTRVLNYESKRIGGIRFTKLGRINIAFSVSRSNQVKRAPSDSVKNLKMPCRFLRLDQVSRLPNFVADSSVEAVLIRIVLWPLAILATLILLESTGLVI